MSIYRLSSSSTKKHPSDEENDSQISGTSFSSDQISLKSLTQGYSISNRTPISSATLTIAAFLTPQEMVNFALSHKIHLDPKTQAKILSERKKISWEEFEYIREQLGDGAVCKAEEITDFPIYMTSDQLKEVASRAKSLKRLDLNAFEIPSAGLAHILELKFLTSLSICGEFTDAELAHLQQFKHLTSLTISGRFTDSGLAHLQELKRLTSLSISGDFSDAGLTHIQKLKHLTSLTIGGSFSDAGLAHIQQLKRLTSLSIYGHFTDSGLVHIQQLERLTSLKIRGNFTDAGFAHIQQFEHLTSLLISGSFTDATLASLESLQQLTSLFIYGSFTDAGLARLENLQRLKSLHIGGNFTDAGLAHLRNLKLDSLYISSALNASLLDISNRSVLIRGIFGPNTEGLLNPSFDGSVDLRGLNMSRSEANRLRKKFPKITFKDDSIFKRISNHPFTKVCLSAGLAFAAYNLFGSEAFQQTLTSISHAASSTLRNTSLI